jgi:tRNA(fMet)-specific endonuclease VapC
VADRIALELERGDLRTTAVTRFELLAGAKTVKQQKIVNTLLDAMPCLPLDAESADVAAGLRRKLEKQGQGIGMGDSLIAGIVVAKKGILLTRNRRHFERISDLSLGTLLGEE